MRQDFFEFTPAFKLVIAGNHKPGLRSVDVAIRRRFNLVPFTVTIPAEERDDQLPDKLKSELPGILAWMIEGCADWLERGLAPPPIVTEATAEYLQDEDALSAWMDECCERDPKAKALATELFESYSQWANRAGEQATSLKKFSQKLLDRGFERQREMTGRYYLRIRLKSTGRGESYDAYDASPAYRLSARARE